MGGSAVELSPSSEECLRWLPDGCHSWRHIHEGGFNPNRYGVSAVPSREAESFTVRLHYSRSWPAARFCYGLWDLQHEAGLPELVGTAVLSVPTNRATLTNVFPDLEAYQESLELGRFVLTDAVPGNGETWFLSEVLRLAGMAGVRGVVSFADPVPRTTLAGDVVFPGHRGAIYQAATALYLGRATPRSLVLLPDGTVLHPRTLQKIRRGERGCQYAERILVGYGATPRRPDEDRAAWVAGALVQVNARRLRHDGPHRYAFLAGSQRQKRLVRVKGDPQAYPKDPRWQPEHPG
ncbi:hypothetical protein GCM10029978_066960 [Actinoallomurus acanthiterrae]